MPSRRAIIERLQRHIPVGDLNKQSIDDILARLARRARNEEAPSASPDAATKWIESRVLEELYFYLGEQAVAGVTGDDLVDVKVVRPFSRRDDRVLASVESALAQAYFTVWMTFEPDVSSLPQIEVGAVISPVIMTDEECKHPANGFKELPDYAVEHFPADRVAVWQHFRNPLASDWLIRNAIVSQMAADVKQSAGPRRC